MKKLIVFAFVCCCLTLRAQTVIDVKTAATPLPHTWSVGTCAGRVNEGLRTSWIEQLRKVHDECGFQYVRMHGLFDDDMCIYFDKGNGRVVYNWQYVDEVYDRMLDAGVRPFVELSFFPKALARENSLTQMWYQNCISFDINKIDRWGDLVRAFTQHVVNRYGVEEVRQWYFEVWNEPNLNMYPKAGFWDGTKSDYFLLYKTSVMAVKSVDGQLKVGGPATSNFVADSRFDGEIYDHQKSRFYGQDIINRQQWKAVWMEDFLRYCAREKLPVDFISCHPYPTDYALDPESGRSKDAIRYVNSLRDDIAYLHKCLANSKYPDAEIHLTEWSTGPNSRDAMHDELPPAAYIVKCCLDNMGTTNSLMYWTFTDIFEEKGGGEEIFHGGFGLINFQGIVKPAFHAFRMMHQLGDEMIYYQEPLIVSRDSHTGKVSAIAFNYPEEYIEHVPAARDINHCMKASSKVLEARLTGLKPGARFMIETLDADHGNVIKEYKRLGKPHSPNRAETAAMRDYAQQTLKETVTVAADGSLDISRTLSPWSVVLITEL